MCIAHDRHPWLMFFGAILPLEADEPKDKAKETKAYSNSTASFLYRGFTYVNFPAATLEPYRNRTEGKKNVPLREYRGKPASRSRGNDAANGSIVLGGTVFCYILLLLFRSLKC